MKNPFKALSKAQRLVGKGRPFAAMLALRAAVPKPAKPRTAAPRPKPRPATPRRPLRPPPGSFIADRIETAQGPISLKFYTPVGSTRRRMPLLVMLHGCTQSANDFALGTDMNRVADELGFLVLYPEQSPRANLARCWNWHRSADQGRGAGEPAMIAAVTAHAIAAGRANPARVYVAGISAGAAAAAVMAYAYPEIFAAIGAHSGLTHGGIGTLTQALAAMRNGGAGGSGTAIKAPIPTIVFHGDQDRVVHPSNAAGFLATLSRSSPRPLVSHVTRGRAAGGREFTRTIYRHAGGPVLLEDWVIHQSGHAWSGGSRLGSHTDPAGPDASREMARFFLARKNETGAKRRPPRP